MKIKRVSFVFIINTLKSKKNLKYSFPFYRHTAAPDDIIYAHEWKFVVYFVLKNFVNY